MKATINRLLVPVAFALSLIVLIAIALGMLAQGADARPSSADVGDSISSNTTWTQTDIAPHMATSNNLNATIIVSGDVIIDEDETWLDDHIISGTLVITNSATLTLGVRIITATNIIVAPGATILADGMGYGPGSGPGAGSGGSPYVQGGGGGHGGWGGDGAGGKAGGSPYGDVYQPTTPGSGGGSGYTWSGGAGGGAIHLVVNNTLAVSGTISANGAAGKGDSSYAGGGGSGGSIWIEAGALVGNGLVQANGGNGWSSSTYKGSGGGGSGGRVALYAQTLAFSGTVQAQGGSGNQAGGPGTLYRLDRSVGGPGKLYVNNGGRSGRAAGLLEGKYEFEAVELRGYGHLTVMGTNSTITLTEVNIRGDAGSILSSQGHLVTPRTLNVSEITVDVYGDLPNTQDVVLTGTGRLTLRASSPLVNGDYHLANVTLNAGTQLALPSDVTVGRGVTLEVQNLTVAYSATILADGMGYGPGSGPGAGSGGSAYVQGGGGGHGGWGGDGAGGTAGGSPYGDVYQPTTPGSGGGSVPSWSGGAGGGAIHLVVSDTLAVSGTISANGAAGKGDSSYAGGGGSGGSIWIEAGALVGNGLVQANGGNGWSSSTYKGSGGGGSGGRVALHVQAYAFSGTVQVQGGSGNQVGEPGTLHKSVVDVVRWSEPLALGQPMTGSLSTLNYRDYSLVITAGLSLLVEVTPLSGTETLAVYSRFGGDLPLWSLYDLRTQDKTARGTYELLIPLTQEGIYYFSVYGRDVSGNGDYQIVASVVERRLSDVTPRSAGNAGEITLNLTGMPFVAGMQAQLRSASLPTLTAYSVTLASPTTLWAQFALSGTAAGVYDVVAVWPGGNEASLTNAFTITPGIGPHLEAHIQAPGVVRPNRQYVIWLEYTNTGDADMQAPLFIVSSRDGLSMRLNSAEPFEAKPVQVLGINSVGLAGRLVPKASGRIPIYFQTPPNAGAHQRLNFDLASMIADATPVDWNAIEAEVKPDGVDPDLWAALWANFRAQTGNTSADYLRVLGEQATYLAQYGNPTYSVRELLTGAVNRASGALPQTLASSLDAFASAPGLPLSFGRAAISTLYQRFTVGPFGRGWSHSFEYSLTWPLTGTIVAQGPGGVGRRFVQQTNGSWQAGPGDDGALEQLAGGDYRLREKDGLAWRFASTGRLMSIAEPNGNAITLTYASGNLIGIKHTNGQSFALAYNAQGRISRLTDHAGQVTDYTYDTGGEYLISVVAPGGVTTTYEYTRAVGSAADHALTTITYPDGTHQFYDYDAQGRVSAAWRDGGVGRVDYAYDALGTVTAKDASGAVATLRLGAAGQGMSLQDPLGNRAQIQYDKDGNPIRLTEPGGGKSELAYDNRGNVTQVRDPLGQTTTLGYTTDQSNLDWLRDARGNLTDMAYDGSGNLTGITYPDGRAERFGYDATGNVITAANRRGDVIAFTYDALGQITHKAWSTGRAITYTYDARGNLLSADDSATGAIAMQYDARNFLTRIEYPGGRWFTFEYNNAGSRTRRTGHDGYTLNYFYDAVGRLQRLTDGSGEVVYYEYDVAGRLSREVKGNGTSTTYEYDAAGQLVRMVNYAPGGVTAQSSFVYAYDVNGNRTADTCSPCAAGGVGGGQTTSYEYDATGQLIGVTYPNGRHVAYDYDAAGNRFAVVDNGVTTHYTANTMNQYTQVGAATYTYDADGNLASKTDAGGTTTYKYDVENRLISMTTPLSGTWQYTYDALGNRIAVNHDGAVTQYVHDPAGLVDVAAEYDGSGSLAARYVYGAGLVARVDAVNQPAYYAFDGTGHTRQLSNASGAVANSYDYDPFGIPLQTSETISNPFRYVGRFGVMAEKNGLNFMRARYYQPSEGRFVSVDPLKILLPNLYIYVKNTPVRLMDPTGLNSTAFDFGKMLSQDNQNTQAIVAAANAGDFDEVARLQRENIGTHQNVSKLAPALGRELLPAALPTGRYSPFKALKKIYDLGCGGGLFCNSDNKPFAPSEPKDSANSEVILPNDPNEKAGPTGAGIKRVASPNDEWRYTIYFENVVTATAPAQEVFVTDSLNPDLDWSTFQVGDVAFGDQVIAAQEDKDQFYARATASDYRAAVNKNWWVDITAQLNYQTGQVDWVFRTLDPETGELPEDALAGFLPPNNASGRGEGHVSFSIKPKSAATLGTRITNTASIVFDTNAPISTNEVWNTLGLVADLAITKTASLPATVGRALTYAITVTNNGPDAATGVMLTDTLPVSVIFGSALSSQGACNGTGSIVCNLGTISNSASAMVTIVVTPTATGAITNSAEVWGSGADPDATNNVVTVTTEVTALTIVPLIDVNVSGPTTGTVNAAYTFIANANPMTATPPITYIWQATGSPMSPTHTSGLSDTMTFTWTTSGAQVVTVTATNAGSTVGGTAVVNVVADSLARITVTPNPITVTVGMTQTFTASGADAFGNAVPISPTWTTDAGTMVGNVLTAQTMPASGRHVTATVGSVSGTSAVTVRWHQTYLPIVRH